MKLSRLFALVSYVFLLTINGFLSVEAQQARMSTFTTFTKGRVTQEQFAQAIETNNRAVLNVDADRIRQSFNATFGTQIGTRAEMASYIRQLEAGQCPQVNTSLMRVHRNNQVIDHNGWTRDLLPGEICLFADNQAMFSLNCGNIIPNLYREVSIRPVEPRPSAQLPSFTEMAVSQTLRADVDANVRHYFPESLRIEIPPQPRSWWSRNWGWVVGPPVVGAIGVGIYCLVTDECKNKVEVINVIER
jgi:hypothetical protein